MVVMKLIADFLLILPAKNRLNMHGLMRYWIPFQIYLAAYILVLPVVALLSGTVRWKGRKYQGRSPHI
jgi:hypothetical protein